MNKVENIYSYIDHTLLKPFTEWKDIEKICDEAKEYGMASVCIPPSYIKKVKDKYRDEIKLCTVIGFPLGYSTTAVKVFEAKDAIENGADEVDMVINICDVKNKNFDKIIEEIKSIKQVIGNKILKVIIETCYLTNDEKKEICDCINKSGADYVKTSTGFGSGGAKLDDIILLKNHISEGIKIKASGEIKTKEDLYLFLENGCSRIGTSSAIEMFKDK